MQSQWGYKTSLFVYQAFDILIVVFPVARPIDPPVIEFKQSSLSNRVQVIEESGCLWQKSPAIAARPGLGEDSCDKPSAISQKHKAGSLTGLTHWRGVF